MITPKHDIKRDRQLRLRKSIRKKIGGGTAEKPRMILIKSNRYLYTQVIDDINHRILAAACSLEKDLKAQLKSAKNRDAAKVLGETIAARCQEKNISMVVFDRNVYTFGGCVKVFADAARAKGIRF